MLIIKDWKGLIPAGISPEQDMVINALLLLWTRLEEFV